MDPKVLVQCTNKQKFSGELLAKGVAELLVPAQTRVSLMCALIRYQAQLSIAIIIQKASAASLQMKQSRLCYLSLVGSSICMHGELFLVL
jgi:hypothetical protein